MKKLLHQKQFVTRDHYFLPEDNESDTQSYKERSFHQQKVKKSKIEINNFTENMNIKINIKIDDEDFSQLKVFSGSSKWKKPTKITANLGSEKRVILQNPYLYRGVPDSMRISKENNQLFHTSIKNPQYDYRNNPKQQSQTIKPFPRSHYNNEYAFKGRPQQANNFQSERKNKRYYNTELFSPFQSQKYKIPQQRKQENYSENFDNFQSKRSQFKNQFSSAESSKLKQKPFFSVQSVQKTDKLQENTTNVSLKQQTRQYKEFQNSGRLLIREQISLDYFSSESSKKKFKTLIQDNSEKEVESQIYLQNQQSVGVENQITPEMGMQQYFFHHSVNDDKNISGFSDSAICQQSNSIEQKLNPQEFQAKNVIKSGINETNEFQIQAQGRKIDFQPQDIDACLKQQNQDERVKANESNQKHQYIVDLSMYEFKDSKLSQHSHNKHLEHSSKIATSHEIQIITDHKSSLRSFHQGSASSDKLSEIDKLRQQQIEVDIDEIASLSSLQIGLRKRQEQLFIIQEKHDRGDYVVIGEESEVGSQQDEKFDFTFSNKQKYQTHLQHDSQKHESQKQHNIQQFNSTAPQIPSLLTKNSSPSIKSTNTIKKSSHQIKQEGYAQRSRSKSKESFIPFSTSRSKMHHHKEHCFEPTKPQPFIFKDYSSRNKKVYQHCEPQIATERSAIRQEQSIKKVSPKKQPKVVKANLTNKKAEDLFTKHKNQFLYKLKMKQNSLNQTISTEQKSREKSSSKRSNLNKYQNIRLQSGSKNNRSISPYVKQLSQRLYSHDMGPVCGHYQKHSKRQLRERFFSIILQDHGNLLKQYYLSNDQLHEIFVSQILNKQMNEHYWIEIVKRQGQRKLQNLRLKSKSKYYPNQRSIIKKQQMAADTKRAYPFAISVLNNSLQKVKAY